jgi:hypothetical protein
MRYISPNDVSSTIIADCQMEIIVSIANSYSRLSIRLRYSVLPVGVIEVTLGTIKHQISRTTPSTARRSYT